ncbi:MAG: DUF2332 domain-containing protein [Sphingomonadales bacterium]|nr:DUF2332 domain-containing protein [Sphingomonadales bacterium]
MAEARAHQVDARAAITWQADHSERNGAAVTARVIRGFLPLLDGATAVGRRMRDWPGLSLEDAMPLRLTGGLHWLHLTGQEARLDGVYRGAVGEQEVVDAAVGAVVRAHDAELLPWLDGPPQTNEAGRSASIVAGMLWLARRLGPRFELNEIGASAGCNTMIERYRYVLGGVEVGPKVSPVEIAPEWRGEPPPRGPLEITAIRGCDLAPIDLADPAQALRLTAYVWPENRARLERLRAIIALARERAPRVERADAADWVERRLRDPQETGVTRAFYHSIVWQYLPLQGRARIEAAMARAGAQATAERPLAWIMLETNRETFRHELRVRHWPGDGEWTLLGEAHAHGAWVAWRGRDVLPRD